MLAVGALFTGLVAACAGCSGTESAPPECHPGRSTLSSLDAGTGQVAWRASLSQTSELPPQVEDGVVVISAPCGAAVLDLADGKVRYDAATTGELVGVDDDVLFTVVRPTGDPATVVGTDLRTGRPVSGLSSNLPFWDAVVADGTLVTLFGDELRGDGGGEGGTAWQLQVPAYRQPRLVLGGHLVLVVAADGSTFAVDPADGALRWRTVPPVAATSYGMRVTGDGATVLTAATTGDERQRSFVYATDAWTGRLAWTRSALGVLGVDRHLTVLRTAPGIVAVDTTTGDLRWRRPAPGLDADAVLAPAARGAGVLVALSPEGVTAVDARTGTVRWRLGVERVHQELALAPDGRLLLLDSDVVPHLGA
ncbi:PQQ-binding-like beta-propeller repeat protein [Nocardioides panaciterrulae]|uniref:Outer membrane protein assembly factor BamB n=1 Tax=Nocardioides panaciterrulae TaxID=661492 RepID=A0A7Y9E5V9_9ACTN|nr:outer membrane protein assembly factor BamB [Nocardioides panaciterrulae]